mmetsp:Transcript_20496/g.34967  ORF Transcript_20496/g.34967 Transcript_20496/m.34967 type:complete len:181 (+) Transcript_20496:21-563(+)
MLFFLSLSLLIYQIVAIDLSPTLEVKLNVNWTGSTGPSDNIYQITFTDIKSDKKLPVCLMKGVGDVSYPVNLYDDSIELPKTVSSRTSPGSFSIELYSLPGPNTQVRRMKTVWVGVEEGRERRRRRRRRRRREAGCVFVCVDECCLCTVRHIIGATRRHQDGDGAARAECDEQERCDSSE